MQFATRDHHDVPGAAVPCAGVPRPTQETMRRSSRSACCRSSTRPDQAGVESGATIGRLVQAEIVHSTELLGRVLQADGNPEDIDVEKAAGIGQARNVDLVLIGTVLEAKSEHSSKGANTGRIFGQSVGANVNKSKATVQLQGDVVQVATGKRIASLRVKGEDSDTKVGATAWTNLGSISSDSGAWLESPLGRAMQKAVAELVKRVNVEAGKVRGQ